MKDGMKTGLGKGVSPIQVDTTKRPILTEKRGGGKGEPWVPPTKEIQTTKL